MNRAKKAERDIETNRLSVPSFGLLFIGYSPCGEYCYGEKVEILGGKLVQDQAVYN